MLNLSSYNNWY